MRRLGALVLLFGAGCTDLFGLKRVPEPPPVKTPDPGGRVAAGYLYTCSLHDDGTAWCWGRNLENEIQPAFAASVTTPQQIGTATWQSIASVSLATCGVQPDQSAWCWGTLPASGFTADVEPVPIEVDPGPIQRMYPGTFTTCELDAAGELSCRGNNRFGGLADGTTTDRDTFAPIAEPGPWQTVAQGWSHACAIKVDGSLWCWGDNGAGQLALPDPGPAVTPTRVGSELWSDVAAALDSTCAITQDGHLRCWGANSFGQLGNGTTTAASLPTPVIVDGQDRDGWVHVRASWNDSICALRDDDSLWCWGRSNHGESGVDAAKVVATPTQVPGAWSEVAVGYSHSCGRRSDGTVWCLGSDGFGELGDGGTSVATPTPEPGMMVQRTMPVLIAGGTSVDVGEIHSCGINGVNQVTCWGGGSIKAGGTMVPAGTLGQGSDSTDHLDPVVVAGTASTVSLSVGWYDSCAIDNTGHARCWGLNSNGELGLGDSMVHTSASILPNTWSSISLGRTHGCGIRTDKSLWCWGANERGQRGDPSATAAPNQVIAGHSWAQVAAGQSYTCAIDTAGGLYCWGANDDGQLANGAAWRMAPVQAR